MAALVHANPVTYAVDLMRHAIGQPAVFGVASDLAVLVGFTVAMMLASLRFFRRE
jgi:ABC-type polysaccharide/polyol phosphate export permease